MSEHPKQLADGADGMDFHVVLHRGSALEPIKWSHRTQAQANRRACSLQELHSCEVVVEANTIHVLAQEHYDGRQAKIERFRRNRTCDAYRRMRPVFGMRAAYWLAIALWGDPESILNQRAHAWLKAAGYSALSSLIAGR